MTRNVTEPRRYSLMEGDKLSNKAVPHIDASKLFKVWGVGVPGLEFGGSGG